MRISRITGRRHPLSDTFFKLNSLDLFHCTPMSYELQRRPFLEKGTEGVGEEYKLSFIP